MAAYYNEHDPKAAAWLRELMKSGLISEGVVDERSIIDLRPADLAGFDQCHFFAGIGGWSLALRLAGIPDDFRVWTGSCPCQPFSAAGKRMGKADERHLWPDFRNLIGECAPPVVFGEQVASKDGREWLAGVSADMEALAYRFAAADLCAAGVGSPHIRQRLFWVADAEHPERRAQCEEHGQPHGRHGSGRRGIAGISGLAESDGWESGDGELQRGGQHGQQPEDGGAAGGLADAIGERGRRGQSGREDAGDAWKPGEIGHAWSNFDIIPCRDGKARRIESGTFPLAHGVSGRVGLLRGYGNAIVPQVAARFIEAWLESRSELT